MKKFTLSLAAITLIATAVQADIKSKNFGGNASLFYGTNDANNGDLFNKDTSYGNAAIHLGGAASVGACDTCTTLNYGITGVSTMGLENTLVSSTWVNHTNGLNDGVWIDTLNLTFNPLNGISNTTMVVGRQALATPLVFTETWNIAKNTYDAAVLVNNDIQDTTLVGAWVGRSNIAGGMTVNVANIGDNYSQFLTKEGAYAFGAVTKLIPTVTAQAWYYVAPTVANVAWLQAETEIAGFSIGAQYGMLDGADDSDGNAIGVKVGYTYEGLGLSAAYSTVDKMTGTSAALGFVNLGGAQTPLYTAGWWNVGGQGAQDTDSFNVTATYSLANVADLGVYYTNWENQTTNNAVNEIALTAGKSFGNLDVTIAYINTDDDTAPDTVNDIQAYFTYNF
jgi:hypothetical protein